MSISKIVFSLSKNRKRLGAISLESLSLGIPVIAYSHGGVKEQLMKLLPKGLVRLEILMMSINALSGLLKPP